MHISVKGNLGSDPELKFSKSGNAYCNFSLAYTPRVQENGEWKDGETTWFRVTLFGSKAEAIADNAEIKKGATVLVVGDMKQSTYTDKEGKERTSMEITATDIGLVPRLQKTQKKENDPWA